MRKLFSLMLIACSLVVWFGCGGGNSKGDPTPTIKPTNLTLSSNVSDAGSGKVTFTATAENATKYVFLFGEDIPDTPVVSETGVVDHAYAFTGTYTVTVVAYSSSNLSIQTTASVDAINNLDLVWSDEFNGTALDLSVWAQESGNNNGWGNSELEYYQSANTTVHDGLLTITAKQESVGGFSYTSSRMNTGGKKTFQYGRVDISAKLPYGQGLWPALWMLGANIGSVGWPACGEIDITEMIGGGDGRDNVTHGTAHWSSAGSHVSSGGAQKLSSGNLSDAFHTFSILWTSRVIKWYLDGTQFYVVDITSPEASEFRAPAFFICNVAVGGGWPGNPNNSTVFPQKMDVDYIRVYQ